MDGHRRRRRTAADQIADNNKAERIDPISKVPPKGRDAIGFSVAAKENGTPVPWRSNTSNAAYPCI